MSKDKGKQPIDSNKYYYALAHEEPRLDIPVPTFYPAPFEESQIFLDNICSTSPT